MTKMEMLKKLEKCINDMGSNNNVLGNHYANIRDEMIEIYEGINNNKFQFKEVNLKFFVISLLSSIIFAIFNLLPLTIVTCTFMLCCFIDKSGYENR